MYFTLIDLVRARLAESDVPAPVAQAYVQVLTNLNALSVLMTPEDDEDLSSPEMIELHRLFAQHQRRRTRLEEQYPILAVLARPAGWQGN